jgi:hypothetical protein
MYPQYQNVILFGAGASVNAGIPVLSSFLDTMWEIAVRGKIGEKTVNNGDRELLLAANEIRVELERYNSRAAFDGRNLEDVLSLLSFESLRGESQMGSYKTFVRAIAKTIELACKHPYSLEFETALNNHGIYTGFWHALLNPNLQAALPALITFNYDLVLERTLWDYFHSHNNSGQKPKIKSCRLNYHFGISECAIKGAPQQYGSTMGQKAEFCRDPETEVEIPYLKLHGSLNWDERWPSKNPNEKGERISSPSYPTQVVEQPLILPPVFNKMNSAAVNDVWKTALEVIRRAKNITIVGYSLPKTDIYMQYFLKSAVGPNSDLQKITVYDPALFKKNLTTQEMEKRYLECFSPQFSNRINFRPISDRPDDSPYTGSFQHFVHDLQNHPKSFLFYP